MASLMMIYMVMMYVMLLVFSVISYILGGKSLSAIARRRGIEKPWLAWVPVGNLWLLGCISDQYRYVVHGQQTNRRGKMLTLGSIVVIGGSVAGIASGVVAQAGISESGLLLILLPLYGIVAVSVVLSVQQYMAYYDLFRSCDPDKSLVYLLVGIFAAFPLPFFVYSCRNKDLGMPPKSEASD